MPKQHNMDLGEDAELLVGATGAVIAADQIMKSIDSEEHQVSHLFKAGVGAAVAIGALELLRREAENPAVGEGRHHSHRSSGSNSRSISPQLKHHDRHLAEEILGAYGLGKELMGDKRHHIVHLVEEAIGAVGVLQEERARDAEEKRRR